MGKCKLVSRELCSAPFEYATLVSIAIRSLDRSLLLFRVQSQVPVLPWARPVALAGPFYVSGRPYFGREDRTLRGRSFDQRAITSCSCSILMGLLT